jgi:hypothetical protein
MTLADARFAVEIDNHTGTLALVSGVCRLGPGNFLVPRAVESLPVGDHSLTLIDSVNAAAVAGVFSAEPAAGEHLGFGVFHQAVAYPGPSVALQVVQGNRSRGLSRFSWRSQRKWDCPPWAGRGQAHFSARNGPKVEPVPGL